MLNDDTLLDTTPAPVIQFRMIKYLVLAPTGHNSDSYSWIKADTKAEAEAIVKAVAGPFGFNLNDGAGPQIIPYTFDGAKP